VCKSSHRCLGLRVNAAWCSMSMSAGARSIMQAVYHVLGSNPVATTAAARSSCYCQACIHKLHSKLLNEHNS
jgi:hypothetical protein